MRTAGMYLLYAAFALRGIVRHAEFPQIGRVVLALALYGVLLVAAERLFLGRPAAGPRPRSLWLPAAYLVVQSVLVVSLLASPPHVDFFAGLFIPLSLQAVLFFGWRAGVGWVAAFSLAMLPPLLASTEGPAFAVAMAALNSGLCFMFAGYAYQVTRAEAQRSQNQQLFAELQSAHRRLQGYAAQVEDLAVEHERGRLARELHDSVTQTVFSMNLTVKTARILVGRDPGRVAAQLDRLQELARSAMREIQALAAQLRPRSVAAGELPAALRQLAAERLARDGLHVTLELTGDGPLSEATSTGLYRIAQEALANVAKHAGTNRAVVRLDTTPGAACLEIEDRGCGFDPGAAPAGPGHLGLAGMAERAREFGWALSVDARPGLGVRVRALPAPPGGTP